MEIRKYPDPVLRKKAARVENIAANIRRLAADMLNTMREKSGVGLAAPQVGESLRMVVIDVSEKGDSPLVLVNPEVVEASGREKDEEGCLSVPGLKADVERPKAVVVEAQGLDGKEIALEGGGLLARVLCHEIDHLNGILFIDKVSPAKKLAIAKALKERGISADAGK